MSAREGTVRRTASRASLLAAVGCVCVLLGAPAARAADDADALFAGAVKALQEGRVGDAIGALEARADRGAVDATASYDRALAYAMRVRMGAELPGDLGEAAQGFEEARDLSRDPKLAEDAGRGLTAVRGELARRRLRAGQAVEVDPGPSLARAAAGLLSENVWSVLAMLASAALGVGLFVRWLAVRPRARVTGGVLAGIAAPGLVFSIAMTLAARNDRLTLVEAVVVSGSARPTDERGVVVPGSTPLPEGARVEVVGGGGATTRIRFGAIDAWVPSGTLRVIART